MKFSNLNKNDELSEMFLNYLQFSAKYTLVCKLLITYVDTEGNIEELMEICNIPLINILTLHSKTLQDELFNSIFENLKVSIMHQMASSNITILSILDEIQEISVTKNLSYLDEVNILKKQTESNDLSHYTFSGIIEDIDYLSKIPLRDSISPRLLSLGVFK